MGYLNTFVGCQTPGFSEKIVLYRAPKTVRKITATSLTGHALVVIQGI